MILPASIRKMAIPETKTTGITPSAILREGSCPSGLPWYSSAKCSTDRDPVRFGDDILDIHVSVWEHDAVVNDELFKNLAPVKRRTKIAVGALPPRSRLAHPPVRFSLRSGLPGSSDE